jgi:hypothetical protein
LATRVTCPEGDRRSIAPVNPPQLPLLTQRLPERPASAT